jgi:hypothetical protein
MRELKSGDDHSQTGKAVQTVPLSSMVKARQIAETLEKMDRIGRL